MFKLDEGMKKCWEMKWAPQNRYEGDKKYT